MDTSFQKTKATDEWFTPKELVEALGEFDLDPCEPVRLLWRLAKRGFNRYDDGLAQSWGGKMCECGLILHTASLSWTGSSRRWLNTGTASC